MAVLIAEKSRAIELLDTFAVPYVRKQNRVYVEWQNRVVIMNLDDSTWITEDHTLGGDLDTLAEFLAGPGI